jgi:hypothetical protein
MTQSLGPPDEPNAGNDPAYALWLAKKAEWWRWHNDNPDVWLYFERFALEAINHGRDRISHWLILNRVRWEVWITTTTQGPDDDDFKIPNEHFAFYARLWKTRYPQHAALFLTKRMIGEPPESPLIGR